jgi:clan AA aspartic protease
MIRGSVTGLQARVGVTFRIAGSPNIEIECVVDTGFEGALALPQQAVAAMGLPYLTDLDANLADNSNVSVHVHLGTVVWNGADLDLAVLAMGQRPLLGTALLKDSRLTADFVDGGDVEVVPLRHDGGSG